LKKSNGGADKDKEVKENKIHIFQKKKKKAMKKLAGNSSW